MSAATPTAAVDDAVIPMDSDSATLANVVRLECEAMACADDAAPSADFSALCTDTIISCFSYLDAYQLGRVSQVCKAWREASYDEGLWAQLVRARWMLRHEKRGRYKYGERSWREVFRVFHRRMKPPQAIEGVAPREFVYAVGRVGRVACWVYVTHLPACRLGERRHPAAKPFEPAQKVLLMRVVLQNLRAAPIIVSTDPSKCLQLTLRDGTVSCPLPGGDGLHDTRVLAPLSACVLTDVALPVPSHMTNEPDVLEACHRLRARVGAYACSSAGHVAPLDVACKFVDEGQIWDHYEHINSKFLVHHDSREE